MKPGPVQGPLPPRSRPREHSPCRAGGMQAACTALGRTMPTRRACSASQAASPSAPNAAMPAHNHRPLPAHAADVTTLPAPLPALRKWHCALPLARSL